MENDSTTERDFTEKQLRESGASALFVAYYKIANPSATARNEIESGPFKIEELNEFPHLGGGFFQALWNGNEEKAFARADSKNLTILEEATGKSQNGDGLKATTLYHCIF